MLPNDVRQRIESLEVPSLDTGRDNVLWRETNDGEFSGSSAYSVKAFPTNFAKTPCSNVFRAGEALKG